MKPELMMKCALSIKACGFTVKEAAEALKQFSQGMLNFLKWQNKMERKFAHRRRCVLIAFAMSQTCSPKKKNILWILFKRQQL